MKVRDLIKMLEECDPDAVVIPANAPFLSHMVWPLTSVRRSFARFRTKEGVGTKYLETPKDGPDAVKVVVLG